MRSPVIAFSIMAAAAVSPNLVAGAPTSPNPDTSITHSPRQLPGGLPSLPGGVSPAAFNSASNPITGAVTSGPLSNIMTPSSTKTKNTKPDPNAHRAAEQQLHNPAPSVDSYTSRRKRAMDMNSAGGNAYSGAGGDTSGGDAVAISKAGFGDEEEEEEFPGVVNEEGATGGEGGDGYSGFVYGGDGDGKGAGGNAYSGAVAQSEGGDVINSAPDGVVENEAAVAGGEGGFDESGDSQGGDAAGNIVDGINTNDPGPKRKRGMDMGTAGGNAYTGASSDVDGGDIINHTNEDGYIDNESTQDGGDAGETYSGEASGGDGDGYGPGGNAYSGSTGSAVGGSVINTGGEVENEDAVTGGEGGESESGDAMGGDA